MRIAPRMKASVAISTKPWGTMLVMVAAHIFTSSFIGSSSGPSRKYSPTYSPHSATVAAVRTWISRLMLCCIGLAIWR